MLTEQARAASDPSLEPRAPSPFIYRGRFAPSPTGPLHFGSLVAAVGSYLAARAAGGDWLVRIEDLDPPREVPGSADQIVRALEAFGFEWTESIVRQSARSGLYDAALAQLTAAGCAFPCSCSRAEVQASQPFRARVEGDELHYPGWCRNGVRAPERPLAVRFRAPGAPVRFTDTLQGPQVFDVDADTGDFVIRRRDGYYAYQLAVVVDDAAQGVTHVVRGCDLLSSTPRQIAVQGALGLPSPEYAHLPVVTDANGIKLSKSTGAAAVNPDRPVSDLYRALRFLRQAPPRELASATVGEMWHWAINHWRVQPLYGLRCGVIDSS